MSSWAPGSIAQYECYISRWMSYCKDHSIDPFAAHFSEGIEFLSDLYLSSELRYSAVNTARSALSSLLPKRDGISFGKDHRVSRLLKGIFRLRPALPKYTVTWDVSLAFLCFIDLHRRGDISRKVMTMKLSLLLGLLAGQRSQTLSKLDLEYMFLDSSKAIFYFPSLLKTSRPTFHQAPLEFKAFPFNPALCPVKAIKEFLHCTNRIEKKSIVGPLFISYASPFKPVKSATIARYIREMLLLAKIDISSFSAHSVRGASTSAANRRNLSISDICKAAGWSSCKTFATFYNKDVATKNFGEEVLLSCDSVALVVQESQSAASIVEHDHGGYAMI